MNKNDILRIARSLYLQQTIARQLFAKFDIDQELSQLDGSFSGRPTKDLYYKFSIFLGSNTETVTGVPLLQFIKKNGEEFTVYGLKTNLQVNDNYSHVISGFDRLSLYLSAISSKIVATKKSFHAKIKTLLDILNCDIYSQYNNETEFEKIYNNLRNKVQDDKIFQDLFLKKKIQYLLTTWLEDIIDQLQIINNQLKKMHLFQIANSIDSIPTYIYNLREIINDKLFDYINNNIKLNHKADEVTVNVKKIHSWILNLPIVKEIQNATRNDLNNSQNNVKNVTQHIGNVWQRVYELNQYVIMLTKHSSNTIANSLLDIIKTANTDSEYATKVNNLINSINNSAIPQDYSKISVKDYLQKEQGLDIENGVQLLRTYLDPQNNVTKTYSSNRKKQYLMSFVDFINEDSSDLLFNTWNEVYKILNMLLQVNQNNNIMNIFNDFHDIVMNLMDQNFRDLRLLHLKAYKVSIGGNQIQQINKNNAPQIMSNAINQLKSKLNTNDWNTIIDNMITSDSQKVQKGIITNNIMKTGANSVPLEWVKGTSVIEAMKNFVNAI